jgi:starch-binding outer membrane protein, SusD/RagB family
MKIYRYTFLVAALILWNCDDKLDIKPVNTVGSSQAVSTSGDVEALMVGAFTGLFTGEIFFVMQTLLLTMVR